MAETLFSSDSASVFSAHTEPVNERVGARTAKATDFKFDARVSRVSPDTSKFMEKGAWPGPRALNGYSSKTVKYMKFKFDAHVARDVPYISINIFYKRAWA